MTLLRFPRTLVTAAAAWAMVSAFLFSHAWAASNDSAEKGRLLFQKRCTGCHSLDKNKEGPRLRGVYGRKAGSIPDFAYSDALKNSKITWDETLLNRWLTNPDVLVQDNDMAFHVSNPDERANIIQFLRVSSGK